MKKQRSLIRRIFSHTLLIINILLVVWSAVCIVAAYISPALVHYIAITNITLPFVIGLNIIFIFFWLLFSSKKIRLLFSSLILIVGYKVFLTVFGLNFLSHNDMNRNQHTLTIMSWNVHGLGILDKHKNKPVAQKILEEIKKEMPDILCMPEYYTPKGDSMKPYARDILSYGYTEYRFCFDNKLGPNVCMGTAVYSKYPLENYHIRHIGNELINVVQADVHIKENTIVRFLFVHLHSFGLNDHEKSYIEELKRNTLETPIHSGVFMWKFNYAYGMRANEADTVAGIINASPYPVVICGDLNDLPGSYTYMTVRGKLHDAFLDKGKWIGRTYNELSPTLRIDHILYDPSVLQIIGYKCPALRLSDHRPVIANFTIL